MGETLKGVEALFKKASPQEFKEMAKSKYYIENTAANLMKELDISKSGKLEKIEMRNICEKIIQKAAGVGWHVLTWGFIHGKCDEIANQADRDKDGSIDMLEFQLFLRGTWLYLSGLSDGDVNKISTHCWESKGITYDVVHPREIPEL